MTTSIAEYSPTEQALAEFRHKYAAVVFDVTTGAGMAEAKAARAELRTARVALEAERKRIKEPALVRCREIDTEAKRITSELEALENPIAETIKNEEDRKEREKEAREAAERQRVIEINARFDAIKALPLAAVGADLEKINALIVDAEAIDPATFPEDMQPAAKHAKIMAVGQLRAARDARVAADREAEQVARDRRELEALRAKQAEVQAELDRLAAAEAERIAEGDRKRAESDRAEREAAEREAMQREADEKARRDAADAIAQAQREADQARADAKAAAIKAEQDRLDTEARVARERDEAIRAADERNRREQEAREQAKRDEDERIRRADEIRAADEEHRASINRRALNAFHENGIAADIAKAVITLIAKGKIPGITINY